MAWKNGEFRYTVALIHYITRRYNKSYAVWASENQISPFSVAEYKADFFYAFRKLPAQQQTLLQHYMGNSLNEPSDTIPTTIVEAFEKMVRILNGE